MPIYEYRCRSCGEELEITQRIVEDPLKDCPACNQSTLERLISATSFQLKGGGWYRDGYGTKKGGERTENQRIDRLTKAIDDDKKTPAADATSSSSGTSESSSTTTSSDTGSSPDTKSKAA